MYFSEYERKRIIETWNGAGSPARSTSSWLIHAPITSRLPRAPEHINRFSGFSYDGKRLASSEADAGSGAVMHPLYSYFGPAHV